MHAIIQAINLSACLFCCGYVGHHLVVAIDHGIAIALAVVVVVIRGAAKSDFAELVATQLGQQLVHGLRHDLVVERDHALAANLDVLALEQVLAHHERLLEQALGHFFADVVLELRLVSNFAPHHLATIVIPCVEELFLWTV